MVSIKYDFPFEVLHMAKLTIKLTCASFVRSSFAGRKNRVAGNVPMVSEGGASKLNFQMKRAFSSNRNATYKPKNRHFCLPCVIGRFSSV
jgi:hypothetical protein